MYLDSIALIQTIPCLAEPGKIIVIGQPSQSLSDVIPYLATLPGIIAYDPENLTLTFRRQSGFMTIYPEKITITQVTDSEEGLRLLKALKDGVNAVWDKRHELKAMTAKKRAVRHLDIWELLPRLNCKQCGESTCLAFAVQLVQGNRDLEECLPLIEVAEYQEKKSALEVLLGT